jgi:Protein of unknown function (DUF2812)
MKKIVIKPYWNVEKEQAWLNRMAAAGYHLTDYFWIRYVFEKAEPGEYTYFIDLLSAGRHSPESEGYLEFLESSGVEVVATYMRWVYLRKRTADGPLVLYSDTTSKLAYLRRLKRFYAFLSILELMCGGYNLLISLIILAGMGYAEMPIFNFVTGIGLLVLGVVFGIGLWLPVHTQMKKFMRESTIFE